MERIREEEKEQIKYILSSYDESDPRYIEAKARVEYEIKCLREEREEIIKGQISRLKIILPVMSEIDRQTIKNAIIQSKQIAHDDWLEYFDKNYDNLTIEMAIAYEELYGCV